MADRTDRIHPFPGNFNPDDVLAEGAEAAPADDEAAAAPTPAKANSGLQKMLLFGAGGIIVLGTIYMSVRPMLGHSSSPASMAAPSMQSNQVSAQSLPIVNTAPSALPSIPRAPSVATAPTSAPSPMPTAVPAGTMATETVHAPVSALAGAVSAGLPSATPSAVAPDTASTQQVAGLTAQIGQLQGTVATLTQTVNALQAHATGKKRGAERAQATPPTTTAAASDATGKSATADATHKKWRREHVATEHREPHDATTATSVAHAPEMASGGPTLKAVVTGRAWFQSSSGGTLTVSPGDNVPVYGRVVSIDATAGEVHFANGAVVR
ncbi:MAG: hypothetical protein ACREPQ_00395 [Rhodanobacter sp.]